MRVDVLMRDAVEWAEHMMQQVHSMVEGMKPALLALENSKAAIAQEHGTMHWLCSCSPEGLTGAVVRKGSTTSGFDQGCQKQ